MGTLSMKVLIVLVSVLACAVAQNVVCGKGTTNKEVTVEDKKTYTFKTQKGKKYPGNTKCTVNYKMGSSCAKMSFACTKFSVKNNDKKKCLKGDKLTVTANGKSKSYCKPKPKPKVSSTGDLSVVSVKVMSNTECMSMYSYHPLAWISDQMLCAMVAGGGQDACQGDSGGPLVTSGDGDGQNYELIGVVSWGDGCAGASSPGVYSRVAAQIAWITETTADSWNSCPRT